MKLRAFLSVDLFADDLPEAAQLLRKTDLAALMLAQHFGVPLEQVRFDVTPRRNRPGQGNVPRYRVGELAGRA